MNRKQAEKSQRSRVNTDVEEASGSSPGLKGTRRTLRHSTDKEVWLRPLQLEESPQVAAQEGGL